MINKKEEIKKKGFSIPLDREIDRTTISPFENTDFSKIRVGAKTLEDANFTLGDLKRVDRGLGDKVNILKAIHEGDICKMREISSHFYKISGIYSRLCRYMAYLYKYDWMVTPYINDEKAKIEEKTLENFYKVLLYLDDFGVKKFFGDVALKVIRYGSYYGYMVEGKRKLNIQELPANYCRSRFSVEGRPAVEFKMTFFDDYFKDAGQRVRMLNLFPKEFKKGYIMYKQGELPPQFAGDTSGWYLLDVNKTLKFNMNGEDYPPFIAVIPAIIDLDEAKGLDKKKMAQQLLKIIIQKMPLDKNGDLIFDVDEAQQLHNNAVNMLKRAVGVDVLTTFADVDVEDMDSNRSTTATDDLERVERAVYNEAGVSQMQFNTDGNIALEKSILNDEAAMYNLITQFEDFMNLIIDKFNTQPKKFYYRAQILTTTIYNYKELAKLYKEQMQVGFSKMLPQIALGQSQSSILANAYFENDILDLVNVFIPPMMSSTMNADALATIGGKKKNSGSSDSENPEGGRPTKESQGEQVSEKTLQNKESQN